MTFEPQHPAREPFFNNVAPIVLVFAAIWIALHGLLQILPPAFVSPFYEWLVLRPAGAIDAVHDVSGLIGHSFLHNGWDHVIINALMSVAFGTATYKGVQIAQTRRGKPARGAVGFIMIFFAGVIAGGLAQWLFWFVMSAGSSAAAVGASGGASALLASAGYVLGGRSQMLKFGLGWLVINLVIAVFGPSLGLNFAWAAHIGGFIGGMALAPMLVAGNSRGRLLG